MTGRRFHLIFASSAVLACLIILWAGYGFDAAVFGALAVLSTLLLCITLEVDREELFN